MSQPAQAEVKAAFRRFSLRERLLLNLITWSAWLLIRLIGPTLRFRTILEEGSLTDGRRAHQPAIYCFWHRCVLAATYQFRGSSIAVMTSRSFDGEYIARIIEKLGYRVVRGSSSRGGAEALLGMREELEMGHPAVFTIDGPRGPIYVAKAGPVVLAKRTGRAICCFYVAPRSAWVLNSWDRMLIPRPFTTVVSYHSSPISVPADATDEQVTAFHRQMQEALERCQARAEQAISEMK